MALNFSWNNI